MKIKLLAAVVISASTLLTPGIARADWVEVAHTRNGVSLRVEENSWARYGNKVVFTEYLETNQNRAIAQVAADCQTGSFQLLELTSNGVRTTYPLNEKMLLLEQAPRGSLRSAAIDFACSSH